MTLHQEQLVLPRFNRGFHLITDIILQSIAPLPAHGLLQVFIQHTSAGICINENADPSVLHDFESFFNKIVPENMPFLTHTVEGPDDMPAHVKAALVGTHVSVPIMQGRLALGVWQGIYLCEFRNHASQRKLVCTIIG